MIKTFKKYHIIIDNVENWNEINFLIECFFIIKRIISLKVFKLSRITYTF